MRSEIAMNLRNQAVIEFALYIHYIINNDLEDMIKAVTHLIISF